MSLESIHYKTGSLKILNQRLLPTKSVYEEIHTIQDAWDAIKTMMVRGAPAIAIVGALTLAVELIKQQFESKTKLSEFVETSLTHLKTARPTAVNMTEAANRLIKLVEVLCQNSMSVEIIKERIIEECEAMLKKDVADNKSMGQHGAKVIINQCGNDNLHVMTHCNTGSLATAGYGTAIGVIRALHEIGKLEHAYCTETRPYNQGSRLTAYEMVHDKIPATLIADSAVAMTMKTKPISAVVVGADRVVANGDTANKIGTYQMAIVAKHFGIPFFVVSPSTSIDLHIPSGEDIVIEERSHDELTKMKGHQIAAPGIGCWNPAFDVTPAELITGGIVTEHGVFKPEVLKKEMEELGSYNIRKKTKFEN
ncbi:methylthioribose-1-phosphate isomerase-like [Saccoglossus kowalevskii]|uniref:Methylthioribose-1-phosphate isomerase n=1 Tax=Saccoglossus kowalevskii TaxID=10224 RepID=A0ABM0GMG9_SACKO|nr:PREDICTED: methylthioribose-1-phosphate isomerase-like [Saccoglossus kowalevskii]